MHDGEMPRSYIKRNRKRCTFTWNDRRRTYGKKFTAKMV
jgi:hypothetical protein